MWGAECKCAWHSIVAFRVCFPLIERPETGRNGYRTSTSTITRAIIRNVPIIHEEANGANLLREGVDVCRVSTKFCVNKTQDFPF